ncbi:ROK family protein [Marivita sp. GX14005]|uniref:ROK family protein n=1 Tax=Marivita sp. GX14005 TaxID=2942276 RepID=UPI002019ED6A|nr:ROK family protein [Marivita sp. GX14005]MCL3883170.1 ROK family protein [Marivita sp. GX14005]
MTALHKQDLTGFAADLGGTKIAAARIERGEVVGRRQMPTDGSAGPEAQLAAMRELLTGLGHARGAPLGIAVAGRIDAAGKWHAVNHGTFSAIRDFDLGAAAETAFGGASCVNDAAAAALGEGLFGAGRDSEAFAYITVSTGVGGGLVLGKRLVTSANGLAGHVGFASSPLGRGPCGSGRRGTVESVAGGRAIAAAAAAAGNEGCDARAVFAAAADGAGWAEEIIGHSAEAIACLIADLGAILGLDTVALGGSIGLAPGYLDRVRSALAQEPEPFRPRVLAAELAHDAPLIGALAAETGRKHA